MPSQPAALCRAVILVFVGLVAHPLGAQEVGRLDFLIISRQLETEVVNVPEVDRQTWTNSRDGAWTRHTTSSLVTSFGAGTAEARHRSEVTDLGLLTEFSASYQATHGASSLDLGALCELAVTFRVSQPITASLEGSLDLGGDSGVQVSIDVQGAGVNLLYGDSDISGSTIEIDQQLNLEPGTFYILAVRVEAGRPVFLESASGSIALDLVLNAGDTDFDGLPDIWEEDGIDGDGTGVVDIDLPGLGADPLRKDIFVEVDVDAASQFPVQQLDQVVQAFADAPVANPDGSTGITLHPILDEQDLTMPAYPAGEQPLLEAVAAFKADHFGTPEERARLEWDLFLRDFKLKCFRYAIIGGSQPDGISGWGEIPGDDFIVTTEPPSRWNDLDRLSTFMHELGHTLGLNHGGAREDTLNHKPNFISVMNYTFQMPSTLRPDSDWSLDYSRYQLPTLDEAYLDESAGLGGPLPYYEFKRTFFNILPAGQAPIVGSDFAGEEDQVDWNNNNVIDQGTLAIDVNRQLPEDPPSPDQILVGHDDWANITLGFFGDNFGSGVSAGLTTAAPEIGALSELDYDSLTEAYGGGGLTPADGDVKPGGTLVRLAAPRPNPVSGSSRFSFSLPAAATVELTVFDLRGRQVARLLSGTQPAGSHAVTWDGKDGSGRPVSSGQYFAVLRSLRPDGEQVVTRKITVLR